MRKFLLSLPIMFLLTSCFNDRGTADFTPAMQSAFQASVDSSFDDATIKSGISVAVYKDGLPVWTYAIGDAATGTAMTAATPGYAYSITKTIVSALILTQIDNGLYSINDTVSDLLTGNADYDAISAGQKDRLNTNATVAQLLSHTSGMLDYASNTGPLIALCNPAVSWKPADIIEKIVNQDLGTIGDFNYSNTNYVLLGMIAEHKGGAPLNTLLSSEFFSQLGLDIRLSPQDTIPSNLSKPYDDAALFGFFAADSFQYLSDTLTSIFPTYNFFLGVGRGTWAAGGIMSTAENLAKWGYELYAPYGEAVTSSVRAAIKNSAAADGSYGYGVSHNSFTYNDGTAGEKYGHGGSAVGYKTLLRYEESQRICVVIMTNANNIPDATANPTFTDSQLGIVDREALADALFNAYNDNQ